MKMFFFFVLMFSVFVVVKKIDGSEDFTRKFYKLNIANLEKKLRPRKANKITFDAAGVRYPIRGFFLEHS